MNSTPRLSMTFLLGPTSRGHTGGAACILEYARRFQALGHEVSLSPLGRNFSGQGQSHSPGSTSTSRFTTMPPPGVNHLPYHFSQ